MDILYIGVIAGLLLGAILSVVFGIYNKSSSDVFIRSLFGISTYDLIFGGIVFLVVASFVFLATISGIVRDLKYPTSRPISFTVETLLMAILPSIVFVIMTPLRGYKITTHTIEEFMILVAKFGILHILLQFSGFYSSVFSS